ncbi:hypothetical protein [Pelagibacterium halotolerans]|uniref:TIGR02588 family protein n=1 Tax=Pelagibacterium halotolerans (strain DSM 22347 / JCM 15775 / CGMCC 1.7692 / B2) TaxID=1082931 RepID=G4RGN4_PELHB|nr:hypothetical protein [Pelagibacterium halotolerans]AEQ51093.1 hypothetical protein KKY_1059 [Pelagibacterium halotolerans B2]QJR19025.1 hypothetical protein HKM20_11595 [Pelagibacterium halotolerans]SEA70879.1 TIGR02588 family protein [Pelagibacterium halotolerans]
MTSGAKKTGKSGERIEWIVAAASAVLVLALAGFIAFEAMTRTGSEPQIALALEDTLAIADGHAARVTIRNGGHVTISDVVIEGALVLNEGGTERASVTLDYLPAESETEIGLGFSQEIDPERLALRIVGFTYP